MSPNFLAFDTATEHLSIALRVRGEVFVHEAEGGARSSAAILPAIRALLVAAGVTLRDLDAIAFGRGPGAFTGLRTACSVAQGLAFGAARPVLPIDTLLAVAEDARSRRDTSRRLQPVRVWAAMDARMNEIYAAHYAFDGAHWSELAAPRLVTAASLNEVWQHEAPELVAGNALAAFAETLDAPGSEQAPDALPRAAAMLPLADQLWLRGGAVDAALALPLYLRDKVAQTTVERDAAKAAKAALEALA